MKNCLAKAALGCLFFFVFAVCHAQQRIEHSTNIEANDFYLKALDYIKLGNPRDGGAVDSLFVAIAFLEKAIAADPRFTKAYIELSNTYWLFDYSYPNVEKYESSALQILPKAKAAIGKALKADSTSSAAYTALARMNLNYEYDWKAALRHFGLAVRYDSSIATNYSWYGQTLALLGRWNEAQRWLDKANSIAPSDSRVLLTSAICYVWRGDYSRAKKTLQKISPATWISKFFNGIAHLYAGERDQALVILKNMYPDYEQYDGGSKALLAYAMILNGQISEGKKILARSYELRQSVNYRAAACYVALKQYDEALRLLEECYAERGNWMIWLKYDKAWAPIRKHKRFISLMKKMRFSA